MRRAIETASLLILLSVVTLRPLIEESYDSSGSSFTRALEAVADPSPLRTLILDVLILLGALGWSISRALWPVRAYRWTGLELGGTLVLAAAVVSCFAAGNKRLAINATIDWLCLPILTIALLQLLHHNWHRRLLLAAILATACVQAAQCLEQRYSRYGGFEDTWEHYQSIKQDFWARQGVDLDSPRVDAFERRLRAREATGFLNHSNIAGSYLVLCAFAAIGAAAEGWMSRGLQPARTSASAKGRKAWSPPGGNSAQAEACGSSGCVPDAPFKAARFDLRGIRAAIATGVIIFGAVLTKSTGALTAGAVGLALWLIGLVFRRWIGARRTGTLLIGGACIAFGVLAVVGYGLKYDRLPGWSLTFRWQYWQASSKLIADHLFTGVGRENFGRHYLRYKPIQSAEEVANPHNLFVQAAADWGVLGLIGIVSMMIGASVVLSRPGGARPPPSGSSVESGRMTSGRGISTATVMERSDDPTLTPNRSRSSGQEHTWAFMTSGVVLLLVVNVARLPLLGTSDPNLLYYATVTTGIYWIIGFACFAAAAWVRAELDQRASGILRLAVGIGLFAFLLHDMINFAMVIPATATTFFALLAFCMSDPTHDTQPLSLPERGHGEGEPLPLPGGGQGGGKLLRPSDDQRMVEPDAGIPTLTPTPLPERESGYPRAPGGVGCVPDAPSAIVRWSPIAAIMAALAVTALLGVFPVGQAASALRLARQAGEEIVPVPLAAHLADRYFQRAARLDPLDPTPWVQRAKWLMGASAIPEHRGEAFRLAVESLEQAITRDPFNNRLRRMLVQVYQAKARATGDTADYVEALKAAQDALELYPLDPDANAILADCQVDAGEATGFEELLDDAIRNYRRALHLDDSRPRWAKLAGLSPRQRETIAAKIARVEQLLADRSR